MKVLIAPLLALICYLGIIIWILLPRKKKGNGKEMSGFSIVEKLRQFYLGKIIGRCLLCKKPIYNRQRHYYFDQRHNEEWLKRKDIPEDKADKLEVHDNCTYGLCWLRKIGWFREE